ncbi:MAG: L,D-transpeptidase family protein [Pseudomonadota bacterium]
MKWVGSSFVLTVSLLGHAWASDESGFVLDDDVIGATVTVNAAASETLLDVGRRFNLGFHDMQVANPDVDIWVPKDGAAVTLPLEFVLPAAPRRGVVLNLPEYRLYYFAGDGRVTTHPISIGRMDWETPLGATRVTAKSRNPSWYVPQSIRDEHAADGDFLPAVVPPGPDNPLGTRALRLGLPGYLIHGTNRPAGVGMRVTHGCLRMFPEDIEALFERVAVGTPVRIVNQPVKAGWTRGRLLLEVHPVLASNAADEVEEGAVAAPPPDLLTEATRAIVAVTAERSAEIDWGRVEALVASADGIPAIIGRDIQPTGVETGDPASP